MKPRLSLLNYDALAETSEVLAFGATKYGTDGDRGATDEERLESALRHIHKALAGIGIDDESGLRHVAHAAAQLHLVCARGK